MHSGGFWNHSIQHSSKTDEVPDGAWFEFWNHSIQHSSKTNNTLIPR